MCGGGGHATLSLAVKGTPRGQWSLLADDVLNGIADDEI